MTNKPTETFRAGLVKAAVFEREAQGQNGSFTSQSVALQTSYKKGEEWTNKTLTLVKKDIKNAIEVLVLAAGHMGIDLTPEKIVL